MKIPESIESLMLKIIHAGYHVYFVGGCVRDDLLHRKIHDYDLTTDALPETILSLFHDYPLVTSGLKHGSVGIILNDQTVEITTHRKQEVYQNHRHPHHFEFTTSLSDDLTRRDFTINALALSLDGTLYDEHGGLEDLQHHIIRCVGDPYQRFAEDALRIMRCIRFSMQLGFSIEPHTYQALKHAAPLLSHVSKERIREEFHLMLLSDHDHVLQTLYDTGVLLIIFPTLAKMANQAQDTPWHIYDLLTHTDIALMHTKQCSLFVKLAVCFHDIGKLFTKTVDSKQIAHYPNHAAFSVQHTKAILKEYHYSRKQIERIVTLIAYHDHFLTQDEWDLKQLIVTLNFDYELLDELLAVQYADNMAKNPEKAYATVALIHKCQAMTKQLKDNFHPILAINGHDLLALGYQGSEIKAIKAALLQRIIKDPTQNTKEQLLSYLKKEKMHK